MPSPWSFKKYGQCGMDVSELFPNVAQHVDDIAFIRSMYALSPAHGPALFQMNTGSILAGHPSVGSWVTYGLGRRTRICPASSSSPTTAAARSTARRTGATATCPRRTRARSSAPAVRRSSI